VSQDRWSLLSKWCFAGLVVWHSVKPGIITSVVILHDNAHSCMVHAVHDPAGHVLDSTGPPPFSPGLSLSNLHLFTLIQNVLRSQILGWMESRPQCCSGYSCRPGSYLQRCLNVHWDTSLPITTLTWNKYLKCSWNWNIWERKQYKSHSQWDYETIISVHEFIPSPQTTEDQNMYKIIILPCFVCFQNRASC